jgi:hypothetical protein
MVHFSEDVVREGTDYNYSKGTSTPLIPHAPWATPENVVMKDPEQSTARGLMVPFLRPLP